MAKHFKNVKSFENLKAQFKQLLKANHPDNGGDVATMQEINAEYDALFAIWKNKQEQATGEAVKETADSTRSQFYTDFGWEGKNHDWDRSLKEVAVIVRNYVKEKYPTYKFSVRTSYASMCQELHIQLKEAPKDIYNRDPETWSEEDRSKIKRKMEYNHVMPELTCWYPHELTAWLKEGLEKVENTDFYTPKHEDVQAMLDDVDAFVKSYNFEDCDGMTDYFHVDFYYFGVKVYADELKIVEKNARIAPTKNEVKTTATTETADTVQAIETDYTIEKSQHTKTGAEIWLVKIVRTLSREEYIKENNKMKALGGYYSKFTHSFIFDHDPSAELAA